MIVITGASDGLGHELAKLFKKDGKTVVNIALDECPVADYNFLYDLSRGEEIEAAANEVLQLGEPIEVLINNAGVWTDEPLGEITEKEVKRTMASNVRPVILLTSHLFERIKKDSTDVVIVSSTAAVAGFSESIVYSTSKWAVRGFGENLRQQLKHTKNRVITFCPDGFDSKLMEKFTGEDEVSKRPGLMTTESVARSLKQIIDLPKGMQVSEIIINRKSAK